MFYIYILRSRKDKNFYTGYTNNLRKRFKEHKDGKSASTKNRIPLDLIYYEACLDEYDAKARGRFLKTGMGKRYIKNRLKRFLASNGLEKD